MFDLEKRIDTPEYDMWWDVHKEKCKADHKGSFSKMEVDGVVEIFQRSQALHGAGICKLHWRWRLKNIQSCFGTAVERC